MEQRRKVKKKCRFCRCPVVDGGVFLPEVDRDKLSRWWSICLDTELDERTLEDAWCCQQCVWDARLLFEFSTSEPKPGYVWWPTLQDSLFNNYTEYDLKHPILNVTPLQEIDFDNLRVSVQKIPCKFCEEKFYLRSTLTFHQQNQHAEVAEAGDLNERNLSPCNLMSGAAPSRRRKKSAAKEKLKVKCTFRGCVKLLESESSLKQHLQSVHKMTSDVAKKCKICKSTYACKISLSNHMRLKHPEARKYKNESHKKVIRAKIRKAQIQIPKTFDCFCCAEKFKSQKHLGEHIKLRHQNSAVKCKICKFLYFKTEQEMEAHFAKEHQFKCTLCPLVSTSKQSLFSHFKKNHKNAIKCGFFHCMFYARTKEEMENHVEETHDRGKKEKSAECIFCERRFVDNLHRAAHTRRLHAKIAIQCDHLYCLHFAKNSSELEEHKKEAHKKVEKVKKSTVCLYCDKPIWDNATYVNHLKQVHPSEVIRCKHHRCFTFFKTKDDLEKHLKERHVSKFTCDFCGHGAARKDYMENHVSRHHLPADRRCPECPKLFKGYVTLKSHIYHVHKKSAKCVHCGETGTNLNRHVVTAECPVCEKSFQCKNLHKKHKLTCKMDFKCSFCDRRFTKMSDLTYHLHDKHKFGADWKGYECQKCKKVFNSLREMQLHRLEDHPSFAKKCTVCEKMFWDLKALHNHLANVHKISDFECKKCDKVFASRYLLKTHLRYNHGKNDPKLEIVQCDICKRSMKKGSFREHFRNHH